MKRRPDERLRIVVLLKTNEGATWIVPQIEELRRRGWEVVVLLPGGDGRLRRILEARKFLAVDAEFDFCFKPSIGLVRGLLRLRKQIKGLRPSVLMYHLYASALAGRLASACFQVRRVHMVPGPLYLESAVISLVERVLSRMDHLLVGGSEYTARRYEELGYPSRRLLAIPYGVDTNRVSRDAQFELPWTTDPNTFVVVMVAFVYAPKQAVYAGSGIKGHDLLVRAWRTFAHRHQNVQLVMVGGGFDAAGERHRQQLISELDLVALKSVVWLDSVPDSRPYYAVANLSVTPSLSENHGAALEASAMSVPSIVSDAGALPETVIGGTTGWIVPSGDSQAIASALEKAFAAWEDGTLVDMGAAARVLVVQRFDQAASADRLVDAIQQLASPARSDVPDAVSTPDRN